METRVWLIPWYMLEARVFPEYQADESYLGWGGEVEIFQDARRAWLQGN